MENIDKSIYVPKKAQPTASNQKEALVKVIIKECEDAIKIYKLESLLQKAKDKGFSFLDTQEKEYLTGGLIKLGEALTFCRDKKVLKSIGIAEYAINFAKARNHFVHHQLYHTHLSVYSEANNVIEKLPNISDLTRKIETLKNSDLEKLSKPIMQGSNDYQFEYSHYVFSLKKELEQLNERMKSISSPLSNDDKVFIENCIRNILAIMVDLTDKGGINKNKGQVCEAQKHKAELINKEFIEKNQEFAVLFNEAKEYRNSLCHLDSLLKKPYSNDKQMLEFSGDLVKLYNCGYVIILEKEFSLKSIKNKVEDKSSEKILQKEERPSKKTKIENLDEKKEEKKEKISLVDYSSSKEESEKEENFEKKSQDITPKIITDTEDRLKEPTFSKTFGGKK